ncbi:MAG: YqaJ viral recombinase family protein [Syntrophorhabdaceae bacterium]|nr:YqaJ viral recombinase family protein [Syntrophorhabdaceae bacterium]
MSGKATDRAQWLARRRQGIGGSDIAGILGLSEYSTPYSVWANKMGLMPEKVDTPNMRLGRDLENYVAQRFAEQTGLKVRRDGRTITNPDYPYSFAHIDRRIVGRSMGLECKTVSPYRSSEFSETEYPVEYYTQSLHYLGVTGWDVWYVAALILDGTFLVYEIKREDVQDEIDEVQRRVAAFWEDHVLANQPPPVDGKKPTKDALNAVFSNTVDACINLDHLERQAIEIHALNDQINALEFQQELYRQEIKAAMGNHEMAEIGPWKASWRPSKKGTRVFKINIRRD